MICFFNAEICYEIENWVNKIWIQHDPQLFFKVPHPSSFWFNLGYSCAPGKLSYKNAVSFLLLYLFCARQIAFLKAFCRVPHSKGRAGMWGFKVQNGLKSSILKVCHEWLGLMCLIRKEFSPLQFWSTYHFKGPVVYFGVKSQVISGFIPAFSVFFAWPWMFWHLLLPCFHIGTAAASAEM